MNVLAEPALVQRALDHITHFLDVRDLLDVGLDTLEAVQIDAAGMEPERLNRAYGDRLSFQGDISVQHLLPHGNLETVRAGVLSIFVDKDCDKDATMRIAGCGFLRLAFCQPLCV